MSLVAGLDAAAFHELVRPMLQRAGCAGATCHSSGLVAFRLSASGGDDARDLAEAANEARRGPPVASPLYAKAIGRDHAGGRVLDEKSCEARMLADWLRGKKPSACPVFSHAPRAADVPPSLFADFAGCAAGACHGGPARPSLLDPARPGAARVDGEALAPFVDRLVPSKSRIVARLGGAGGHPRGFDGVDDPRFRRLFAWLAGEPTVERGPSRAAFERDVEPILERRGCTLTACHGAAGVDLVLVAGAPVDNYLRLVPRVEARLFPAKPKNALAHGGGRRLGGADDCAAAIVDGWLAGAAPAACAPRPLPDRARFPIVQASLEALTCPKCHADERLGFRFVAHPDAADLERNYQSVIAKLDLEYPPVSSVLLRVREDCMQSRILAWIERRPDPGCTVELKNFKGRFPEVPRGP